MQNYRSMTLTRLLSLCAKFGINPAGHGDARINPSELNQQQQQSLCNRIAELLEKNDQRLHDLTTEQQHQVCDIIGYDYGSDIDQFFRESGSQVREQMISDLQDLQVEGNLDTMTDSALLDLLVGSYSTEQSDQEIESESSDDLEEVEEEFDGEDQDDAFDDQEEADSDEFEAPEEDTDEQAEIDLDDLEEDDLDDMDSFEDDEEATDIYDEMIVNRLETGDYLDGVAQAVDVKANLIIVGHADYKNQFGLYARELRSVDTEEATLNLWTTLQPAKEDRPVGLFIDVISDVVSMLSVFNSRNHSYVGTAEMLTSTVRTIAVNMAETITRLISTSVDIEVINEYLAENAGGMSIEDFVAVRVDYTVAESITGALEYGINIYLNIRTPFLVSTKQYDSVRRILTDLVLDSQVEDNLNVTFAVAANSKDLFTGANKAAELFASLPVYDNSELAETVNAIQDSVTSDAPLSEDLVDFDTHVLPSEAEQLENTLLIWSSNLVSFLTITEEYPVTEDETDEGEDE